MLFDLYTGGHHGQYVRQLVEYWGANDLSGRLDVVVPARFFETHEDVRRIAEAHAGAGIRCVPIAEPIALRAEGVRALAHNDRTHGRLLRAYVERLRPSHCVCMYFDHVQLSLALDLTFSFPVHLSGIYFRPSFHYRDFSASTGSGSDWLTHFRKRLLLAAALRNRHVSHLFCLDPYVVPYLKARHRRVEAVALPDGITPRPALLARSEVRARWGVAVDRRVALFFGSIAARKGIHQTLEALRRLSLDDQQRLCLALVGAVSEVEKDRVQEDLHRTRRETAVQVVVDDRFVEEEEIQGFVEGADLVLLPYQRHVGSSGVLVRAAHARVPVLGPAYGLVGEHLRRRTLGLPVDTTSPDALAAGLTRWLAAPDRFPFDAQEARRFAQENTAERFAATLFHHVAAPTRQTAT